MADSTFDTYVSKLSFPLPLWRYILIFQSWQQLRSWTFIVSGIVLSFCLFFEFLALKSMPIDVVLFGVIFGSIFSVIMVAPVEFRLKRKTDRLVCALVDQLYDIGYIQESQAEGTKIFRQKLPSWLRWNEGKVTIANNNNEILVKGGVFVLSKLRHCAKKYYSAN